MADDDIRDLIGEPYRTQAAQLDAAYAKLSEAAQAGTASQLQLGAWLRYTEAARRADEQMATTEAVRRQEQPTIDAEHERQRQLARGWDVEAGPFIPTWSDAHQASHGAIHRANDDLHGAMLRVEQALGGLITAKALKVGDSVRTPFDWGGGLLKCATIRDAEAGDLATAVLTQDGQPVATDLHSHQTRTDGSIVAPTPVRFEMWWGFGRRAQGWCDATTRGVIPGS